MNRTLAALLLALGTSSVAFAAAPPAKVRVSGGDLQGVVQGDLAVFKGIPFARPPVGDLRWRAPQPVSWTGVRTATALAPPCMQPLSFLVPQEGPPPSEDCLYLNVWAPAQKPAQPLPVMVWIHGGAFSSGAPTASMFDGTAFAHRGVILVSIAYRLGPFGFLAHPELSRESGHGSGDYGLQDQIAALRWVRTNIAAFGGDVSRVTVFGQSAGAGSVSMLAASPLARGLFQRAIAESGASFSPARSEGFSMLSQLAQAEQQGQNALAALGAPTLADARKLPAEQVLKAKGAFRPSLDGYVLTTDQHQLYIAGRQNDTPVLVGSNSDEGAMGSRPTTPEAFEAQIRATYGAAAPQVLAVYPHATAEQARLSAKNVFRDSGLAWNVWTWARMQSKTGRGKVYAYYFDQKAPKDSIFYSPDGTVHTGEIPYVFGTLEAPATYSQDDKALSNLVMSYWVNFARTGDPNGPGLPTWPNFADGKDVMMRFDAHPAPGPTPNLEQLRVFDAIVAAQRKSAG